jgi:hypothetical protein
VNASFGQFPAVEFVLEMTAMPTITGHIEFSNCHSLERIFQFDTEILHRKSGRLFSRFLNACLTPLNVTIQVMKAVLAIHQEQKYKRHRPETTLLYQLVERYYPEFTANSAAQGRYLPKYVEREFDEFLRCGRLE